MKPLLTLTLVLSLAVTAGACGPRKVEVTSGAPPVSEVTLAVTNNLSEAVNVYVIYGGNDIFLKQVPGKTTERLTVPGVPAGSTVSLRAAPKSGSGYRRDNITLSGLYEWQVP